MLIFFSSHGNSLIGLLFLSRGQLFVCCFCSCDVRSDLVYIDVCSDLVFADMCSILLPTMRSEIFCFLSSSINVVDGRGFGCLTQLREF